MLILAILSPFNFLHGQSLDNLLDTIETVESGGNVRAIGDNGRSKGPYQIQRAYWADACGKGKVKWDYETWVWNRSKSRQVIRWYWERYCPQAYRIADLETLARVHNGGPTGARKATTIPYWNKVKGKLK